MEFTATMIAGLLDGDIVGNEEAKVHTLAKIEEGHQGALSFLANPKYEQYLYDTESTIVIVNRSFVPAQPVKATMIRVDDAYGCFAKLLEAYAANKPRKEGISPRAEIDTTASLGEACFVGAYAVIDRGVAVGDRTQIYPHVYLGDNVRIGNDVTIHAGVKIYEGCVIGNGVIIHAGSVIGADGFGFAPDAEGRFSKIPQIGNVVIEDDVEIGANTTIDRATMGSTVIHQGVKLDNQIQVGHNVVIGENTVCAAQVGIAGSTKVGAGCMLGGQVGLAGHIAIGDRVQLGSKSGISNNIPDDQIYMGYPALPVSKFHRSNAVYRNLPELSAKVHQLEKQVRKLIENE